jgi:hypothetical protein
MQVIVERPISGNGKYTETLHVFNTLLSILIVSDNEEGLEKNMAQYFAIKRSKLEYLPFSYGYSSEGLELYQDGVNERVLFVPCKTDIEI